LNTETSNVVGATRSAGGHAFRVEGAADVVSAAEDVFATFPAHEQHDQALMVFHVQTADRGVLVHVGDEGEEGKTMADIGGALDYIQWHLNQSVIRGLTAEQTGLHAACAERNGRLVLLPAPSGGGKSTTVAGLLQAGWSYLTDEASVLDNTTLEIAPYPKPITLVRGSWHLFPQTRDRVRSEETCLMPAPLLGRDGAAPPAVASRARQIAVVVAPSYAAGAKTSLEPMTPGELVLLLAQSTFAFDQAGARHLRCLASLARTTPGYRLIVGDLDEAVAAIESVVTPRC
jgi:hypothetical protein